MDMALAEALAAYHEARCREIRLRANMPAVANFMKLLHTDPNIRAYYHGWQQGQWTHEEFLMQCIVTLHEANRRISGELLHVLQRVPTTTIQMREQCCPLDNDHDGNCRIHSAPGVLRRQVQ